jgi:hypothetical protein
MLPTIEVPEPIEQIVSGRAGAPGVGGSTDGRGGGVGGDAVTILVAAGMPGAG